MSTPSKSLETRDTHIKNLGSRRLRMSDLTRIVWLNQDACTGRFRDHFSAQMHRSDRFRDHIFAQIGCADIFMVHFSDYIQISFDSRKNLSSKSVSDERTSKSLE